MLRRLFFRGEAPGTGSGGLLRWILATSLLPGGTGLAGLHRTARLGYGDLGPWQTSEWRPGALPSRQQGWPRHLPPGRRGTGGPEHAQFIPGLARPCTAFGLSLIPHTWQGPRGEVLLHCDSNWDVGGGLKEDWVLLDKAVSHRQTAYRRVWEEGPSTLRAPRCFSAQAFCHPNPVPSF